MLVCDEQAYLPSRLGCAGYVLESVVSVLMEVTAAGGCAAYGPLISFGCLCNYAGKLRLIGWVDG